MRPSTAGFAALLPPYAAMNAKLIALLVLSCWAILDAYGAYSKIPTQYVQCGIDVALIVGIWKDCMLAWRLASIYASLLLVMGMLFCVWIYLGDHTHLLIHKVVIMVVAPAIVLITCRFWWVKSRRPKTIAH